MQPSRFFFFFKSYFSPLFSPLSFLPSLSHFPIANACRYRTKKKKKVIILAIIKNNNFKPNFPYASIEKKKKKVKILKQKHQPTKYFSLIQDSRFFNDGLALAPDAPPLPLPIPFILPCRPRFVGGTVTGVSSTRPAGDTCVTGGDGTGALRTRSAEYMGGGGPPFNALIECCGECRVIVACTCGGDADDAYGRGPAA